MLVTCQPPIGWAIGIMTAWTFGLLCSCDWVARSCGLFVPWVSSPCPVVRDWPCDCSVACDRSGPNNICVVLNHLASPTLQGICPVQALEVTTPDIIFLLHFSFYEPVYYRIDSSEPDLNFPSPSNEKKSYWVGFADNQGDSLTWRILTEDTQKIIIRSGVRSALRTTTNQRLASPSGEGTTLPFPIPYSQSQNSLPLDPLDASAPNFEHFV